MAENKKLLTVIHSLRPVREVEPNRWKLRWRPIKHDLLTNDGGTWNLYQMRTYNKNRRLGIVAHIGLPEDGSQYGRHNNGLLLTVWFWFGGVEFWVKWGFVASATEHGDGVAGIDLKAWGIAND